MPNNRQFVLAARPVGAFSPDSLRLQQVAQAAPGPGEVLVKTDYIAVEPAMKGWMENRVDYVAPLAIGEVMRAFAAGHVVASNHNDFSVGQRVSGMLGMQEYAVVNPAAGMLTPIAAGIDSATHLGVLGITGLTAYCGMQAIAKPRAGDTVLVSGAAGATGSVVTQLAKIAGCRVIGIAGGQAKCEWLLQGLGLDAALDYKADDIPRRLAELCPEGVNIYWDNVGGELLDIALNNLALGARIVVCGGISRYSTTEMQPGPVNYFNLVYRNASMQGFVVSHYSAMFAEAVQQLREHLLAGNIKHREDVLQGFEQLPQALLRLFNGDNIGKQLVAVT